MNQGSVLLLDNELHKETLTERIEKVADAMDLSENDYDEYMLANSFRGDIVNVDELSGYFAHIEPGRFSLVILDSFYRFMPRDFSENDSNSVTQVFNTIDKYAGRLNASFACSLHTPKGDQGGKAVTDLARGSSAFAGTVDTQVGMFDHKLADMAAVEITVRSFPPVPEFSMQFGFPLWYRKEMIAPERKTTRERKNEKQDSADKVKILEFIVRRVNEQREPQSASQCRQSGVSPAKCLRLVPEMHAADLLEIANTVQRRGSSVDLFQPTEKGRESLVR